MRRLIGGLVAAATIGTVMAPATASVAAPDERAAASATERRVDPGWATDARIAPRSELLPSSTWGTRSEKVNARIIRQRFWRETVRPFAQDVSPQSMAHVRELQFRLRWAGFKSSKVTGVYGTQTQKLVKRFQKRVKLRATGVVDYRTWKKLIPRTVQARKFIPNSCRGDGWRVCYDRRFHSVTVFRDGVLWNNWLVRGGSKGLQTRTGEFRVFRRSKDHVSSLYGTPMPHAQFFDGGQAFHGSPFMENPYVGHSHGCVNMYLEDAQQLWYLTVPHSLYVRVYGRWS